MRRYLLLLLLLCPAQADDTVVAKIATSTFEIRVSDEFYTQLAVDDQPLAPFEPTEYLRQDENNEITEFQVKRVAAAPVEDEFGKGQETVIVGRAGDLQKTLKVTVYADHPEIALFQTTYQNVGQKTIPVTQWVNNGYRVPWGNAGLWSFQGGSYEDRYDWARPLNVGEGEDNFQGMNADDYGGGIPIADIWSAGYGLAVGVVESYPTLVKLPVDRDSRSFGLEVVAAVAEPLNSGDILRTKRTFVSVHQGDFYRPLTSFVGLMKKLGYAPPDFPDSSYEPVWCSWGYEREVTPQQLLGTLDKAKSLGFKWAVLDDGWQTNEGDWELAEGKFTSLAELTARIRAEGLRPKLWWAPLAADPDSKLVRDHPDYLLLDKQGKPVEISWWDAYYLCPAYAPVNEYSRQLVNRMMVDWGFDGLKIDGQHLNAAPLCYNEEHGHNSPAESHRAMPQFQKLLYETARGAKSDSVVEVCPCGTTYAFHNLPYTNQPVSSDPESSYQIRMKGKVLKALMGADLPYYGDHVELSDGGEDFASTIGVGGVIGSKFTLSDLSSKTKKYDLSRGKEFKWGLWSEVYERKMLPRGRYRGDLYTLGFDFPETHVVEKDGVMHYAFYAPKFEGKVELRGLADGSYTVTDYVRNKELGTVTGESSSLEVKFEGYLLVEAVKS